MEPILDVWRQRGVDKDLIRMHWGFLEVPDAW